MLNINKKKSLRNFPIIIDELLLLVKSLINKNRQKKKS